MTEELELDLDVATIAKAAQDADSYEDEARVYTVHPGPASMDALATSRRRLALPAVPVIDIAASWNATRTEANRITAPALMDEVNTYLERNDDDPLDGEFEFRIETDREAFVLFYLPPEDSDEDDEEEEDGAVDGDYILREAEDESGIWEVYIINGLEPVRLDRKKDQLDWDGALEFALVDMDRRNTDEAEVWEQKGEALLLVDTGGDDDEDEDEDEDNDDGDEDDDPDIVDLLIDLPVGGDVREIADILVTYQDDEGQTRTQVCPLRSNGTLGISAEMGDMITSITNYRRLSGKLSREQHRAVKEFIDLVNFGLRARAMGGKVNIPARTQALLDRIGAFSTEPVEEADDDDGDDEGEEEEIDPSVN